MITKTPATVEQRNKIIYTLDDVVNPVKHERFVQNILDDAKLLAIRRGQLDRAPLLDGSQLVGYTYEEVRIGSKVEIDYFSRERFANPGLRNIRDEEIKVRQTFSDGRPEVKMYAKRSELGIWDFEITSGSEKLMELSRVDASAAEPIIAEKGSG